MDQQFGPRRTVIGDRTEAGIGNRKTRIAKATKTNPTRASQEETCLEGMVIWRDERLTGPGNHKVLRGMGKW
jgi:hypothetical protein